MLSKRKMRGAAFLLAMALGSGGIACKQSTVMASDADIPTATVKEVDLQLKVFTKGALHTEQSRVVSAPPIAGGTLQIIQLAAAGTKVHAGDVVLEFDPSQQEYNRKVKKNELKMIKIK